MPEFCQDDIKGVIFRSNSIFGPSDSGSPYPWGGYSPGSIPGGPTLRPAHGGTTNIYNIKQKNPKVGVNENPALDSGI